MLKILKFSKAIRLCKIVSPFSIFSIGIKRRYKEVVLKLDGHDVFSPDRSILLGGIDEIFINEIYNFNSFEKSPTIIDCGANIGLSVIYFKKKFPYASIYAFEADPEIFVYLLKNINSYFNNHDINLINKAVWYQNGSIAFRPEGGASGRIEIDSNNAKISIPSMRLKDHLEKFDSIELLKMDIEGAEVEVLLDCNEALRRCRYIFVEFHSFVGRQNRLLDILNMLNSLGFRYYFKEAVMNPHPFKTINIIDGMDFQVNIFFINNLI